ncbi:uncharacterized protein LOC130731720 [Lotus japonicus]|uniref:uncharacterized protein LOC130731720 n=1 Tax=Lotus japonicus TaxID=34305 RepID=UPI00258A0F8A|nr:uncharacterized protein LOC130731720 [Lotus japonicus]
MMTQPLRRLFLKSASSPLIYMARATMSSSAGVPHTIHRVHTEKPQNEDPMAYYIRTLSTVLGSEEAAKKAFVVAYGDGDGFTAVNLTPDQAHQISNQPGVYSVRENNRTYNLRSCCGTENLEMQLINL